MFRVEIIRYYIAAYLVLYVRIPKYVYFKSNFKKINILDVNVLHTVPIYRVGKEVNSVYTKRWWFVS